MSRGMGGKRLEKTGGGGLLEIVGVGVGGGGAKEKEGPRAGEGCRRARKEQHSWAVVVSVMWRVEGGR